MSKIRIRRKGDYYQVWKNDEKQSSFMSYQHAENFARQIEIDDEKIEKFNLNRIKKEIENDQQ